MGNTVKKLKRFFHDVKIELKKVNWPDRRELATFTGIVLVVIFVVGAFFWVLDTGLTGILRVIIN